MKTAAPAMVVLLENDRFAPNTALLNTDKAMRRTFGRELQNRIVPTYRTPKKNRRMHLASGSIDSDVKRSPISRDKAARPSHLSSDQIQAIIDSLKDSESKLMVNKDFMKGQRDVNGKMRAILIDWLVDVCLKFELLPQVLPHTVQLIDRYLEAVVVTRNKLQLVGIACLMMVCKLEEIYPPMLKDYLSVCDNAYSKAELLRMEGDILIALNFELVQATPSDFLSAFKELFGLDDHGYYFAQYVLEVSLTDLTHMKHRPSVLAAAAVFFVAKVFKKTDSQGLLQNFSVIQEQELKLAARDLFVSLRKSYDGELGAVTRKFASPDFLEVSLYRVEKRCENGSPDGDSSTISGLN
jgi:cyclin B